MPFLAWPMSSGLPAMELAVAKTLGFSFFGFLVSLLPLFFSLDMGVILCARCGRAGGMPARSDCERRVIRVACERAGR